MNTYCIPVKVENQLINNDKLIDFESAASLLFKGIPEDIIMIKVYQRRRGITLSEESVASMDLDALRKSEMIYKVKDHSQKPIKLV